MEAGLGVQAGLGAVHPDQSLSLMCMLSEASELLHIDLCVRLHVGSSNRKGHHVHEGPSLYMKACRRLNAAPVCRCVEHSTAVKRQSMSVCGDPT